MEEAYAVLRRPAARCRPGPARSAARPSVRHDRAGGARPRAAGARHRYRRSSWASPACCRTRSTRRGCGRLRTRTAARRGARCCSARCESRSAADEPQAAMRAYFNLSFEREGVDDHPHSGDTDGLALAERTGDQQWKRSFLLHTVVRRRSSRATGTRPCASPTRRRSSPGAETDHFARGGILLTRSIDPRPARGAREGARDHRGLRVRRPDGRRAEPGAALARAMPRRSPPRGASPRRQRPPNTGLRAPRRWASDIRP